MRIAKENAIPDVDRLISYFKERLGENFDAVGNSLTDAQNIRAGIETCQKEENTASDVLDKKRTATNSEIKKAEKLWVALRRVVAAVFGEGSPEYASFPDPSSPPPKAKKKPSD